LIDATLGLGGHALRICSTFPSVVILGVDQDEEALAVASKKLADFKDRVMLVKSNFKLIDDIVMSHLLGRLADAVLFDLGVSSMQVDDEERGFSFNKEGPLDMRMDKQGAISAYDLINKLTIDELTEIFYKYGEERYSHLLAKAIVRYRERHGQISSTTELVEIVRNALPARIQRHMGKHPARKIFQALRIVVNDEINALKQGLTKSVDCVRSGGVIIVLSYHSLEDRLAKQELKIEPGYNTRTLYVGTGSIGRGTVFLIDYVKFYPLLTGDVPDKIAEPYALYAASLYKTGEREKAERIANELKINHPEMHKRYEELIKRNP